VKNIEISKPSRVGEREILYELEQKQSTVVLVRYSVAAASATIAAFASGVLVGMHFPH